MIWGGGGVPCCLVPNKSFFSTHGMVFIWQYLTDTFRINILALKAFLETLNVKQDVECV
jgi:hypothetical protein